MNVTPEREQKSSEVQKPERWIITQLEIPDVSHSRSLPDLGRPHRFVLSGSQSCGRSERRRRQGGTTGGQSLQSSPFDEIPAHPGQLFPQGNTLTMKVNWFGKVSGKKYTSNVTMVFEQRSARIADVKYSDNGPWAHEPAFVEKWRRDANKQSR
jgi:hypothetical protein